ncbi:MAG: carbon-nitrogen hydrolase family protein [candidate division Zixibacteria bacterium]|nr:carbon-nitrogen hydrolase family protein [candidate division Zixibacteria bacterium]
MGIESTKIAAIQASSVFMDLDATITKACRLIEEAAAAGATLAVFPEAFVPGFPIWVWFVPPGQTHALRTLYALLHRNSVSIPGPEITRLAQVAADCRITVVMGVNERNAESSNSTLYDTILYIGADGHVLGKHRKFIPTTGERLVWGQGAECDLEVFDLPFGRLSGLLCWENYMPLARYALSAWGEQIHAAPTWDRGQPWIPTMQHVAKEGRCFVVSACQSFHKDDIPDALEFKEAYLGSVEGWINPGLSLIVDPDGKIVAGPLEAEEGILYADVERHQLVGPRWQLDIAGHSARPDLFELRVHRVARPFLQMEGGFEDDNEQGNL